MYDIFSEYNWAGITLMEAHETLTFGGEKYSDSVGSRFYQLGIKITGHTEVKYNEKCFAYKSGTVLYIPKASDGDKIHYTRTIKQGGVGACIFFDSIYPLYDKPAIIQVGESPDIGDTFVKLTRTFRQGDSLKCMELMYRLLRCLKKESGDKTDKEVMKNQLLPALEYIHAHICDSYIDISVLSELCGLTPDYFRQKFKCAYSLPPLQYLNMKKCELAKEKLLSGKSVTEISRELGFASVNYFSRFFKQHTALTPMQYISLRQNSL